MSNSDFKMEQEEIWVARHDYVKERDDVLSFHKGDRFKVMSKSNDQWWAVKNLATYDVGYAPATYLEVSINGYCVLRPASSSVVKKSC